MNLIVCSSSLGFGITPVPIDQTGSYAINKLDFFLILSKPSLICLYIINLVFPRFLSTRVSPIQNITFNFALIALLILRFISLSVSPFFLFYECPNIT